MMGVVPQPYSKILRALDKTLTTTPSGSTATLDLSTVANHILAMTSGSGLCTVTLTPPASTKAAGGVIQINHHATTVRNLAFASTASINWVGTQPTWTSFAAGSTSYIDWWFNGTALNLSATVYAEKSYVDSLVQVTTGIVYVDAAGNNGTGERNNPAKPFATLAAAQTAASAGDLILVRPGTYTGSGLGSKALSWYFLPGAIYSGSGNPIWNISATSVTVDGCGEFVSLSGDGDGFVVGSSSSLALRAKRLECTGIGFDLNGNSIINVDEFSGDTGDMIHFSDSTTGRQHVVKIGRAYTSDGGLVNFGGTSSPVFPHQVTVDEVVGCARWMSENGSAAGRVTLQIGSTIDPSEATTPITTAHAGTEFICLISHLKSSTTHDVSSLATGSQLIVLNRDIANRLRLTGGTLSGSLSFSGTGHAGLRANNLTTAQITALGSIADGFIPYDSDLDRLMLRANASTRQLIDSSGGQTIAGSLSFSGTTNSGIQVNNLTAAQRDALTPVNGNIIYNTDTNQLNSRHSTGWRQLIDNAGGQIINNTLTLTGSFQATDGVFRNGTTPTSWTIHETFTDASNYSRLRAYGVAGGAYVIATEALGTGTRRNLTLDASVVLQRESGFTGNVLEIRSANNTLYFQAESFSNGIIRFAASHQVFSGNSWKLADTHISFGSGNYFTAVDVGIKRSAAGMLEVNDGATAGTFRDVRVRNLIQTLTTPASASATGTAGTITADADYVYVCTATNTWKRVAIATW